MFVRWVPFHKYNYKLLHLYTHRYKRNHLKSFVHLMKNSKLSIDAEPAIQLAGFTSNGVK